VWRARIVLMTGDGIGTNTIMRQTGKSKVTVWRRQKRFLAQGVDGLLRDKTRPSRIPRLPATVHERTVALTQTDPPGRDCRPDAPIPCFQRPELRLPLSAHRLLKLRRRWAPLHTTTLALQLNLRFSFHYPFLRGVFANIREPSGETKQGSLKSPTAASRR
jgi:hypothetical protein